jgi:hypothetical protein
MGWILTMLLPAFMLLYPLFCVIIFALIVRKYPKKIIASYLASTYGIPIIITVLVWSWALLQFAGQCGGWLGETSPCKFPQYAREQLMWSAMVFIIPFGLSILLNSTIFLYKLYQTKKKRAVAPQDPN